MSPLILTALILSQNRSENYPDIPENHVVYDAIKRFKSEGYLPEIQTHLMGNRPFLRFEIAEFIVHVEINIRPRIGGPNPQALSAVRKEEELGRAKALKEDVDILQQITPIFLKDFPKFVNPQEVLVEQREFAKTMDGVVQSLTVKP